MANRAGYRTLWRYAGNKARFMITFGLISLVIIFFGVFIIFLGIISLFTIVGVPNPNPEILLFFPTGLAFIIVGVVSMIIYVIGMNFVPPPAIPEEMLKYQEEERRNRGS
ncbi:MAG: hypothetical protein ACXAEU_06310 [Candidatus Hodarchaeales archaeon]|jgi:membrane protein implicated in regulation of membrane protease activity